MRTLQNSGWLKNYLRFRLNHPFPPLRAYLESPHPLTARHDFDKCLYHVVQENGVLLGCPVVAPGMTSQWKECGFPEKYADVIFVYLETLFSVAIQEKKLLNPEQTNDAKLLKQVVLDVIYFYLKQDVADNFKNEELYFMLSSNKNFLKSLTLMEKEINRQIKVKKMFSSSGHLQNLFGFLEIYYFLQWHFAYHVQRNESDSLLHSFLERQIQLKEQLILMFSALVWADEVVMPVEAQVMQQYIDQARLPLKILRKFQKRIRTPVLLEDLSFSIESDLLKKYLLQTLILLSLIDNQQAPQEDDLILKIAMRMEVGKEELDLLYMAVIEFFAEHGHNFNVLTNNPAVSKLDQYVRAKIMVAVQSSLENIMTEIRETGELSVLLAKATSQPLTDEEKRKVKEQLMDIAKTVPALAIFCLPAGGIVLAVLIKLLPFKILPSAFNE
ncbi:MAG: hypothetical protein HQM13_21040 [SAR324 cluster bacterium]|nr:hypothetical protein [SAR324 cluster bacterium]